MDTLSLDAFEFRYQRLFLDIFVCGNIVLTFVVASWGATYVSFSLFWYSIKNYTISQLASLRM